MRVTVLMENSTPSSRLAARHGLSLWLELADGRCVLFDMGPAVYEKIKRKKEDGTWERVIGPKIQLPGEKFRMAVHVLASIVFLFAWYMVYVWICLYKLEN